MREGMGKPIPKSDMELDRDSSPAQCPLVALQFSLLPCVWQDVALNIPHNIVQNFARVVKSVLDDIGLFFSDFSLFAIPEGFIRMWSIVSAHRK